MTVAVEQPWGEEFDRAGSGAGLAQPVATNAVRRVWGRLRKDGGHLLIVGAAGQGKTAVLTYLHDRCVTDGVTVRQDPAEALSAGDVLLLDDASALSADEARALCTHAGEVGARVVMATRPDSEWRRAVIGDPMSASVSMLALEPWSIDDAAAFAAQLERPETDTTPRTTPAALGRLVLDAAGLPWLVAATIRGDASGHLARRLRNLVEEDHELLIALSCGATAGDRAAFDRLSADGLLAEDSTVPPAIRRAVLRHGPHHRVAAHVESRLDALGDAPDEELANLSDELVGVGLRDARLASVVERSADDLLTGSPERSADRYRAAIEAGGDAQRLGVKRAEAQALAGDVVGAQRTLESVAPMRDGSYLQVATATSLLAWQPERAAELWRWAMLGDTSGVGGVSRCTGAYALFGVGESQAAGALLASGAPEAPSTAVSLLTRLTDGIAASLTGDGRASLPSLIEAASVASGLGGGVLLPDHPGVVAALLCLGSGDVAMAETVLAQAWSSGSPSRTTRSRLSALRAWVAMISGRYDEAERLLDGVDPTIRRDEPWHRAVRIGLARRRDDIPELTRLWAASRSELLAHPPDLYALLPLGELGLAGARMRDDEIVDEAWGRAMVLLERLGDPPAWSATFHWYGVQAAILGERPKALAPHAAALVAAARVSPYAGHLAHAARAWVATLGGNPDARDVESAARALAHVGQAWEGARLAAHAAARVSSKRETAALLECARDLRADLSPVELAGGGGVRQPTPPGRGGVELTPREREVAELVLAGLTYREIGARLFLSAKTVEHHMARIKRRSDASTRGDLLRILAATLHGTDG